MDESCDMMPVKKISKTKKNFQGSLGNTTKFISQNLHCNCGKVWWIKVAVLKTMKICWLKFNVSLQEGEYSKQTALIPTDEKWAHQRWFIYFDELTFYIVMVALGNTLAV